MITLPGRYCDGEYARSCSVELRLLSNGHLQLVGETVNRLVPRDGAIVSDRLGTLPRFLRLSDGGVVETPDSIVLEDWLDATAPRRTHRPGRLIHWLESRATIAAVATALVIAAAILAFSQGLPQLARRTAHEVPLAIEQKAGWAAYSVLTQSFSKTALSYNDRMHVRRALDRLLAVEKPHAEPTLLFFQMGTPNAFALPGGILIVSDELYHLAANDDEIAAVLAHELGHIEKRHGLQSVLRNSTALILVSTLTGDLSTLSTFSATLPFLLLQFGYAREFEREADAFAAQLLAKAGIDPVHLARILERLDQSRPSEGADFSYLSTHPSTAERIDALRAPTPATAPPPP